MPVAQLRAGQRFVVRPGERIAADGQVLSGQSAVDTSMMTGESVPADVGEGDQVTAGTIANGSLSGSPFSFAFTEVAPGEVNVIGSSSFGPNLAYGQTATLFLVSLTVKSNAVPTAVAALAAEMIVGAAFTISVNDWVVVPAVFLAVSVIV